MSVKLTAAEVSKLKPPAEGRIELSDTVRPGLKFRMSSSGNATWVYQKKIKGGVRRGFSIGSYPAVSLSKARELALELQFEAERGIDRIEEQKRAAEVAKAEAAQKRSVAEILEVYIKGHVDQELKEGHSRKERKRQLNTYLAPYFSKGLNDLTRADLQAIVDAKQKEGKVAMANRLRAALMAFTRWAYLRGYSENDAGAAIQKAGKERARERTPSLSEVREIWRATADLGPLWGPFFRLCILTGQRNRSDVLHMRWEWIDFEKSRYEVPNPKNGRPHIVHLSSAALAELESIRGQISVQQDASSLEQASFPLSGYVFTTTGTTPASGVTKAKMRLDTVINQWRCGNNIEQNIEHWVLHDLRRSQATALAEAGFDEGVVDRIQNHVAGGSRASAVAAVYNKAQRLPERARALDAWADMVLGRWASVVPLDNTVPKVS